MNAAPKNFVPEERPSGVRARPATVTDLASWAQTAKPKTETKKRATPKASFDRALVQVDAMMQSDDWTDAKSIHVFALYCRLHEHIYKVQAGELAAGERQRMLFQVSNLLKAQFAGDIPAIADFVRWAWQREIGKMRRRAAMGTSGGSRLAARWLFTSSMVSDYRVDLATAHSK